MSVCLSQTYRVWCLIIISVATFPVLRAVCPAIASVPIVASIQGVPDSVDSRADRARWESVHASFLHKTLSVCLSVTLREEHRVGFVKSGMLRKVLGIGGGELTGDWRRLHGEELHDFILSLCILLCYWEREIIAGLKAYLHSCYSDILCTRLCWLFMCTWLHVLAGEQPFWSQSQTLSV
jgi:hypothetical protein